MKRNTVKISIIGYFDSAGITKEIKLVQREIAVVPKLRVSTPMAEDDVYSSIPTGIMDAAELNTEYIELLKVFGIPGMNQDYMVLSLEEDIANNRLKLKEIKPKVKEEPEVVPVSIMTEGIPDSIKTEIIKLENYSNYSTSSLSSMYSLDCCVTKKIVSEGRRREVLSRKKRAKKGRRKAFQQHHIDFMEEYIKDRKFSSLTVAHV